MSYEDMKPGDIIGFSGAGWISSGINVVTYGLPWWSISHVGIIGEDVTHPRTDVALYKEFELPLLLFESTEFPNQEPCEITREPICGTQAHDCRWVVNQYKGAAWHYKLTRELYPHERARLSRYLNATCGTPYDVLGAMRSGGMLFAWAEALFRTQNANKLFCSEWVAAAAQNVGILQTSSFSGWSPNYLVRYLRRMGWLHKPERLPR